MNEFDLKLFLFSQIKSLNTALYRVSRSRSGMSEWWHVGHVCPILILLAAHEILQMVKMAQSLRFRNTNIQLGTVARSVTRLLGEFCLCNFVAWPRNKEVSSDSCVT